jgi:hypothetical protein
MFRYLLYSRLNHVLLVSQMVICILYHLISLCLGIFNEGVEVKQQARYSLNLFCEGFDLAILFSGQLIIKDIDSPALILIMIAILLIFIFLVRIDFSC